jgi:L-asparaginase / beta-aspartyl-peptidase
LNIRALSPISLGRLIKILAISALSFSLPAMAQDQNGWQFDSLRVDSTVSKTDAQQIYEVLLKMLDRWNAHDIEGYLKVYWKSPELLVVVDSEQFNGWQQLHDSYINGHPDRNSMGVIDPKRIQVKLLKPDLALALTWWSISFPSSKQKVVGNTTMNLQKFDDGWKVVAAHSSTAEI